MMGTTSSIHPHPSELTTKVGPRCERILATEPPALATRRRSSTARPFLRHSNNLHSGSFLEDVSAGNHNSDNDDDDFLGKELHKNCGATRHHLLHNHHNPAVVQLVTNTHKWDKFHQALKRKRKGCCTHASIQQYITQLIREQEQQQEQEQEGELRRKEQEAGRSEEQAELMSANHETRTDNANAQSSNMTEST